MSALKVAFHITVESLPCDQIVYPSFIKTILLLIFTLANVLLCPGSIQVSFVCEQDLKGLLEIILDNSMQDLCILNSIVLFRESRKKNVQQQRKFCESARKVKSKNPVNISLFI